MRVEAGVRHPIPAQLKFAGTPALEPDTEHEHLALDAYEKRVGRLRDLPRKEFATNREMRPIATSSASVALP
jgi:hypothetical protein